MLIAIIIILLIIVYLFLIAPNTGRQEEMTLFSKVYIAHRGLFNNGDGEWVDDSLGGANNTDKKNTVDANKMISLEETDTEAVIPENSLPAFIRAVEMGYGIELDTQTTADGRVVVFHDESLYRMCGVDKKLYECTYEELMKYRLAKMEYRIPLLSEALEVIDGKVPLIVEVKSEGNWQRTTRMTAEHLDAYKGKFCVESFHPLVLSWLKKNRPDVLRGQLSTNFFRSTLKRAWYENIILINLMLNFLSRPDFIAYNYRYKNQPSFFLCRKLFHVVTAAWTIRNEQALIKAKKVFDVIIFDSFIPD